MRSPILRTTLAATAVALCLTAASPLAPQTKHVYVASNAVDGNELLVFERSRDGMRPAHVIRTGGTGTGAGLGNQGGLILTEDERFLFVVNAGSDSVSAFSMVGSHPRFVGMVPSGGQQPISIAVHRRLLYVLNAGGAVGGIDGVAGFRIDPQGALTPIAGSFRPLSADSVGPAQVGFSASGRLLLVTEKDTHSITVFPVLDDGTLGPGETQRAAGETPFGFDVTRDNLVYVTEAFGGAADASAVSVYEIDDAGQLIMIDRSVPTTETAACWIQIGRDGRFGYTTNTGSDTLTGFGLRPDGTLELLDGDGVTAKSDGGPLDLAFSRTGRTLFVLNGDAHTIAAFSVDPSDGSLGEAGQVEGLPKGANGLAAR